MKSFFRTVGITLFLVGTLLTIGYKLELPFMTMTHNEPSQEQTATITRLNDELKKAHEQIASLEKKVAEGEQQSTKEREATEAKKDATTSDKGKVQKGTIYIYEAISLYDIGKQVEDLGILANGRELELYLSKPEYARSIQKGQFDLDSSMTLEQMARILTGKKGQ